MANFFDRLRDALGESGYDTSTRRSVQSAVIFEAYRSLEDQLPKMRPFQRKLAVLDQAKALVEAITDLAPHHKAEILWRTMSSKECMDHEAVWKRAKAIERELEKLAQKIKPFCGPGKKHYDTVDDYIQEQYEQVTERKGIPAPLGWEHVHNNNLLVFRMYYKGTQIDTELPPPAPIKDVVVPVKKPRSTEVPYSLRVAEGGDPPPSIVEARKQAADIRRSMLKEVRLHMDLIKEFEGIIPESELVARKRQLYMAMPDAPPPVEKRQKYADDSSEGEL